MKRTPPWVFVAAVGVQLAALGLCLWAMDHILRSDDPAAEPIPPPPAPEPAREALVPPEPLVSAAPPRPPEREAVPDREPIAQGVPREPVPAAVEREPIPPALGQEASSTSSRMGTVTIRSMTADELAEEQRFPEPVPPPPPPPRVPEPYIFHPEPGPRAYEPEPALGAPPNAKVQPAVVRVQSIAAGAPAFGPPPVRPGQGSEANGAPAFIGELADATTQIVCGRLERGRFAFGFYSDGNIRFVDVDGGRYTGKAESARARMREVDGPRAFTVQIGVAADGRLQASFSGGAHDAHTIALEPLAGGSTA